MSIYVNITKDLGDFNLNLEFNSGDSIGLLGASGCGKSMTLRAIAGIVEPDSGIIKINNRTVFDSDKGINLPPQERNVGFVFQNYALFPHMTVGKNISFSVKENYSAKELDIKVRSIAKRMNILDLLSRYPRELSGGQQQRVALARALIRDPEILLLDEPFSALDSYLKSNLQEWLEILVRNFHGPVVFVSHNISEVSRICQNLIVLDKGRVVETGQVKEVLHYPKSIKTAILSGYENISPLSVIDKSKIKALDWNMDFSLDHSPLRDKSYIGFRGIDIFPSADSINSFTCKIRQVWDGINLVKLDLIPPSGQGSIYMEITRRQFDSLNCSDSINISIAPEDIRIFN